MPSRSVCLPVAIHYTQTAKHHVGILSPPDSLYHCSLLGIKPLSEVTTGSLLTGG